MLDGDFIPSMCLYAQYWGSVKTIKSGSTLYFMQNLNAVSTHMIMTLFFISFRCGKTSWREGPAAKIKKGIFFAQFLYWVIPWEKKDFFKFLQVFFTHSFPNFSNVAMFIFSLLIFRFIKVSNVSKYFYKKLQVLNFCIWKHLSNR